MEQFEIQLGGILLFIVLLALAVLIYDPMNHSNNKFKSMIYILLLILLFISLKIWDTSRAKLINSKFKRSYSQTKKYLDSLKIELNNLEKSITSNYSKKQELSCLKLARENLNKKITGFKNGVLLTSTLSSKSRDFLKGNAKYLPWKWWFTEEMALRGGVYSRLE